MPLYNNAETIRRALDSLLAQSYTGFRILISDDGSTDGGADICDEYAQRDSRIEVFRQPKNLNYGNFRYLLERAATPFFMFAAGDDYWHRDYAARMIEALDQDAAAVCAVSRVAFVKDGGVVPRAGGTEPLLDDAATNIVRFLAGPAANTRMYGIFRTDVARRAFPPRDFHAYDWAFSVGTLREGTHIEVPEVLMWRDHTDPDRYIEYVRRDARGVFARLFPMLPLTADVLGRLRVPKSYALIRQLFWLNAFSHLRYLQRYHPSVAPPIKLAIFGAARIASSIKRRVA
jgi:glycosyltransferase involved in cell wall biosynthesis